MERNSFLSHSWAQMLFGAVKIMLCINLPVAIGMIVLPMLSNTIVDEMLKLPSNMKFIQVVCLNILVSAMAFDVFFFWEGVRAGFRTWAPKMIKNLIVATGAFLVSVVLIYITWDKAVVNFGFLTPKIGLEQAFWLAIPIRVVIALYKAITGILSSIKEGNDKEFESNKKPENKTQEPEVRGKLPNYRRHPSHQPPQKREQPIQYPQHQ